MSSPAIDLIEKLRKENLDQFFILVRMHLSFIVDINTDDVDCSTEKPKPFRWNFNKKIKSSLPTNSSQIIKPCLDTKTITDEGIFRLNELIEFLSLPENVTQEGIFRRIGSLNRQQELKQLLQTDNALRLCEGRFSVHDCASVLKNFLAELPQPLLTDQYYQTYCTLSAQYPPNEETSQDKLLTALQLLLLLLTPAHRSFVQRLLGLLRLVADNEPLNRMSPDTLATMFTPHLLCPRKLSPEAFHLEAVALSPVVSFMISHASSLFQAPASLATDAGAYFTRRHAGPLDESISDKTAANTVYSFVDRNRSKAESETNPTDTALAQLYAHIQALPESQHKRRLIKHFNRQNGYGTPIQIQRNGKPASTKSLGDSIKRHIFHKGILNKTPKKGSSSAINTIEEKFKTKTSSESKRTNTASRAPQNKTEFSADENYDSDSNESTLSDGGISQMRKTSPKFASEPNLSMMDSETTPKKSKRIRTKLFISKAATRNKKYEKKPTIKGTPTSCVSCFDDKSDNSDDDCLPEKDDILKTPLKEGVKDVNYITSTPGFPDAYTDSCVTPYAAKLHRASMSPISKSTQKLSKAMQESIMTPRSRKPLIMIVDMAEQRDITIKTEKQIEEATTKSDEAFDNESMKNDSDFVSSDDNDTMTKESHSYGSDTSKNVSLPKGKFICSNTPHSFGNPKAESKCPIDFEKPVVPSKLDLPKSKTNQEVANETLTEPFKDYLLSRSVLTATPIDLSINKSVDDDKISDSLMYCLEGNMPSDLTSSISNLAVESIQDVSARSPLKSIDNLLNLGARNHNIDISPNRKRPATNEVIQMEIKRVIYHKDMADSDKYSLRETDL